MTRAAGTDHDFLLILVLFFLVVLLVTALLIIVALLVVLSCAALILVGALVPAGLLGGRPAVPHFIFIVIVVVLVVVPAAIIFVVRADGRLVVEGLVVGLGACEVSVADGRHGAIARSRGVTVAMRASATGVRRERCRNRATEWVSWSRKRGQQRMMFLCGDDGGQGCWQLRALTFWTGAPRPGNSRRRRIFT